MKRTLLVDTNRAAVPIYRALCDLGHEVWVVGGKPTETLAKLASNYVQLDYSDVDRLAALVAEKAFDFLVPGCTDLSYKVCAEINEALAKPLASEGTPGTEARPTTPSDIVGPPSVAGAGGFARGSNDGRFPGIDTSANTRTINSKDEFRKVADELGISTPRVLSLEQAAGAESVIVKPVDSFSGRGMTVLQAPTPAALNQAFESACQVSKTENAIIEEFVTGQLFSHSAFIWNGAVTADFIVQEHCTTNPFAVDTSRLAVDFPATMLGSLRQSVCRLVSALRLESGVMHTQFIARGGRYWIIEVTRRCPGDLYSLLIEFSTGYPYAASYVAPFVGEEQPPPATDELREHITRHTVTSRPGASLWGFRFSQPVDIRLFVPLATSGDFIAPSPGGRAGIVFFRSPSESEHENLYRRLLDGRLYAFS